MSLHRSIDYPAKLITAVRITGRFAARLPGFGILTHVGRKFGKVYRTPINVFRAPTGFVVALTYSSESEWVKNVLAAGGCELRTRGKKYQLSHIEGRARSNAETLPVPRTGRVEHRGCG